MTKNNLTLARVSPVENTSNPIPQFPYSRRLALHDKDEIENFVRKYPPYSDYNFTSLYCYNINDKVEVSWLNGNLVILFQDYISDEVFYSFLGENKAVETALTLLKFAEESKIRPELRLIPEHTVKNLNSDGVIQIKEDENNFDYILSIPAISEYKRKDFSNKRNHTNQFKRKHPNHDVRFLDLKNEDVKNQILILCKELIDNKVMNSINSHELPALKRLLDNTSCFNVLCIGVFVQEKLTSFIICEQVTSEFAIGHFEKSNIYFEGIPPFLLQELSKELKVRGCIFFNYEQDLGIAGLRTVKQRFRPAYYLKKYTISRNTSSTNVI